MKKSHQAILIVILTVVFLSIVSGPAILFGYLIFSEIKLDKVDTEQMYVDHADDLQTLADFALRYPDLTNISKESSFGQRPRISRLGRGVYLWWKQTPIDLDDSEAQAVQQAFRNSNIREITNYYEDGVVVFDLYSSMANTKMLVYTKSGEQLENEYVQLTGWLSPNWYMAESHPR